MSDWDSNFLSLANTCVYVSKDPSTKVGAVIVNDKKKIIRLATMDFPEELKMTTDWTTEKQSMK